jgi:SPP1 family predicted phage head-tail adaptor
VIELRSRDIQAPTGSLVDYNEQFVSLGIVRAGIKTKTTISGFDGTNIEGAITHVIIIDYRSDVTAETWIKFKDKYYDISTTENIDEEDVFLRLNCVERGTVSKPVNFV